MENVLELYRKPYDPQYPVLCMDEASKQLIAETRVPLPAEGSPRVMIMNTNGRVCAVRFCSLNRSAVGGKFSCANGAR